VGAHYPLGGCALTSAPWTSKQYLPSTILSTQYYAVSRGHALMKPLNIQLQVTDALCSRLASEVRTPAISVTDMIGSNIAHLCHADFHIKNCIVNSS
jgi:hypothetical protein